MDKQAKQALKRPRVLTLCMLAATVSTLALAGCGNGEEDLPPAQQPETMEQDATSSAGDPPAMNDETTMGDSSTAPQEPAMNGDPGLEEDAANAQEPMPGEETDMNTTDMNTTDMNTMDPEEEPGFGEGTDPMPGANEDDDEMTNG